MFRGPWGVRDGHDSRGLHRHEVRAGRVGRGPHPRVSRGRRARRPSDGHGLRPRRGSVPGQSGRPSLCGEGAAAGARRLDGRGGRGGGVPLRHEDAPGGELLPQEPPRPVHRGPAGHARGAAGPREPTVPHRNPSPRSSDSPPHRPDRRPITTTSANRHGQPSPTSCDEAKAQLGEAVDLYIDAGPSPVGRESSVVDLSGPRAKVLRQGALPTGA